MKKILYIFLLLLSYSSNVQAQIKCDEIYAQYQPIIIENVTPILPGAIQYTVWEINGGSYREHDDKLYVWAAPGKYEVSATTLQTKKQKVGDIEIEVFIPESFKRFRETFQVGGVRPPDPGPNPPPDPQPNPTIPNDEFENVGQRVNAEVARLGITTGVELAKAFDSVAEKLETFKFLNVSQASDEIQKLTVTGFPLELKRFIFLDGNKRIGLSRAAVAKWYRAVAVGLKGKK